MSTSDRSTDALVNTYLREVERALTGLPSLQKDELLADLSTHIDNVRETLPRDSEAEVRQILDRLGPPETVAAAARADELVPVSAPHRWLNRRVAMTIAIGISIMALATLAFFYLFMANNSTMY